MADKKFTLLELNLGDGTIQIGPATLGGDDGLAEVDLDDDLDEVDLDLDLDSEDDGDGSDDGSCLGRTVGKLFLAVLALVVVTLVVKKLRGGSEDLDELEDLADLDEE
jgi:hypothetical protein